jgi:unsaturated rhamnogalacturonyl hydrolase
MNATRLAVVFTFLLTTFATQAQQYPKPNPTQQAGIDKDNSRHFGDSPLDPGPLAKDLSPALTPAAIDLATRKVADWELARAQPTWDQIWTSGVLYSGFMATSSQLNDPKYSNAMLAMARGFHWQLRGHQPNQDEKVVHLTGADDQDLAQTYFELYLLDGKKDATMIALSRADFDAVIPLQTLRANDPKIPWWWCDALFMAPAAWARLATITGDHKYIDYLNLNWQRTSDLLYDKQDHLYARDATYIGKLGPNGKKIYWSRGEGWVLGGIARTLEYLPVDDPKRPFYVQQMREMSAALAPLQETTGDAAGLWHSSLLDPKDFPLPENSGSALILFGMAYGVNHGILDRATYMPIITRAWAGLLRHIYSDGRLGDIQQTGAEPTPYYPGSSYDYGIGGYLLAAAELKKLAAKPISTVAPDTVANTDPAVYAKLNLPSPANPKLRNPILVGDSTMRNGKGDGAHNQMGWGDELAPFFDTSKINVVNRAIGGRSSRTYISEGHWAETLKLVKPGDVILIQFGHNDSGPLDDADRARGSINGTGPESKEVNNPVRHVHETVYTFGHYLDQYIKDAHAHGATPILCSLVPRKIWKDGHIERQTSTYRGWTREIAERDHVGYIDLNEITAEKYDALGEVAVEALFGDPHTHTTATGAVMNAESVVQGLKALPKDPVAADFSARGQALRPFAQK